MTEAGDGRGAAAYRPAGRRRQLAEHCADLEPLRRWKLIKAQVTSQRQRAGV
jgi:hypothetical protein